MTSKYTVEAKSVIITETRAVEEKRLMGSTTKMKAKAKHA